MWKVPSVKRSSSDSCDLAWRLTLKPRHAELYLHCRRDEKICASKTADNEAIAGHQALVEVKAPKRGTLGISQRLLSRFGIFGVTALKHDVSLLLMQEFVGLSR